MHWKEHSKLWKNKYNGLEVDISLVGLRKRKANWATVRLRSGVRGDESACGICEGFRDHGMAFGF